MADLRELMTRAAADDGPGYAPDPAAMLAHGRAAVRRRGRIRATVGATGIGLAVAVTALVVPAALGAGTGSTATPPSASAAPPDTSSQLCDGVDAESELVAYVCASPALEAVFEHLDPQRAHLTVRDVGYRGSIGGLSVILDWHEGERHGTVLVHVQTPSPRVPPANGKCVTPHEVRLVRWGPPIVSHWQCDDRPDGVELRSGVGANDRGTVAATYVVLSSDDLLISALVSTDPGAAAETPPLAALPDIGQPLAALVSDRRLRVDLCALPVEYPCIHPERATAQPTS